MESLQDGGLAGRPRLGTLLEMVSINCNGDTGGWAHCCKFVRLQQG